MNAQRLLQYLAALMMVGIPFALTGCGGEEKQAEIDRLTEEIEYARQQLVEEQGRTAAAEDERRAARDELMEVKGQLRVAEGRAKTAERSVERFQQREEAAALAKANEPNHEEKAAAAKEAAGKHLAALVTIKGDAASGTGFLVEADGKTWIYLAPSSLSGNAKLEITQGAGGKLEKFGEFQLASDAALARLEVLDEVAAKLTIAEAANLESGVALLGVGATGALAEGRSYGVEGTSLTADSRFTENPTGTPVFSGETGALLGVMVDSAEVERVLWEREIDSQNYGLRVICRLDRKIEWTALPIGSFLEEAKLISDADRVTRLVHAFAAVTPTPSGLAWNAGVGDAGGTARKLLEDNKSVSAVSSLFALDEWLKEKGARASEIDRNKRVQTVYEEMARAAGRNTEALAARKFSPFNAKAAAKSLEWRKEAEQVLADLIKAGLTQ